MERAGCLIDIFCFSKLTDMIQAKLLVELVARDTPQSSVTIIVKVVVRIVAR